jgi:rhamnose utilization protein RhaD (predicted bifunctional aldolase and dehydrogenase)
VALDETSLAVAWLGSLYPDHVVFLGRGITVLHDAAKHATINDLARALVSEARRVGMSDTDIQHAVEAQL